MQTSNCNQTMTEQQQLVALSLYTEYLRSYIEYAHDTGNKNHFEFFASLVWASFYQYMDNKTDNEGTLKFAKQAFNFAHSYFEAKQSFLVTIQQVIGSDYAKYETTIAEIVAQISRRKLDTANI